MVIAALSGFAVAVQFVSAEGLELPYYVVLIGAGVLKLSSPRSREAAPDAPVPLHPAFRPEVSTAHYRSVT
jgi:hypothetical protein